MKLRKLYKYILLFFFTTPINSLGSEENLFSENLKGFIGFGYYTAKLNMGTNKTDSYFLPYGLFTYKKFFFEINTFGTNFYMIGKNSLRFVARIDADDYVFLSDKKTTLIKNNPYPLGLSLSRLTSIGSFSFRAFHDIGKSNGNLFEINFSTKLPALRGINIYPQLSIEHQSKEYANHFYGIELNEAKLMGLSYYNAPETTNFLAGILIQIPLSGKWHLTLFERYRWLGNGINDSPLTTGSAQNNFFISLSYKFE